MKQYKSPAWKSRAVRHSAVRTKRQAEKRPQMGNKDSFFVNSEEGVSSRRNNAPKIKGRRLYLEISSTINEVDAQESQEIDTCDIKQDTYSSTSDKAKTDSKTLKLFRK